MISIKKVALIGIGPHAKRIYLNYFKQHKIDLELVVDLSSHKEELKKLLELERFKNTKIYTLNDKYKDCEHLPKNVANGLLAVCKTLEITHFVISTEPKAHFMYIEFALKNNINVLTDKPITVKKNMVSLTNINKVRKQYYEILKLSEKSKASCKVMCQRQYHRGYETVKSILAEVVSQYQIPITDIEIFHSDGNWEMPHDLEKENHPYKYGYGKLYHSGFHFIDLLSDLIKINDCLIDKRKKIVNGEVFSKVYTPNDEINCINISDYKNIFSNQQIPNYYNQKTTQKFKKYGEKNYHGLLTFSNQQGFTITTATLNLLHDSISRRSWIETKDFYKQNGRIRHERVNIEVGHLLNIQIHSYQTKEIHERTSHEEGVGGLEHFDIYIFRNPIIKGNTFEKIQLSDLYSEKEKKHFLGYNELSREDFLTHFFNDNDCKGDIKNQALAIEILYSCSMGIYNYYKHINKSDSITVRNKYTHPFNLSNLKKYTYFLDRNLEKKLINHKSIFKAFYHFDLVENYVHEKKIYEVYFSISDNNIIASGLLTKTFYNKYIASFYFYYLNFLVLFYNIYKISKKVEGFKRKI